MEVENSADKPRKKTGNILLWGSLSLIVVLIISHFVWTNSGSNEWKLVKDENGLKIWTLKTPGKSALLGKTHFRVKSTLGGLVKIIEDPKANDEDVKFGRMIAVLDPIHAPGFYSDYVVNKLDMPFPFKTRELICLRQHIQNQQTKKIEINLIAAPNRIDPDGCCVRITHLSNTFTLTPLENGEVDIEYRFDTTLLDSVPYFIRNLMLPNMLTTMMVEFKRLINMEKYKTAKLEYIKELH